MDHSKLRDPRIIEARRVLEAAKVEHAAVVVALQAECNHPHIAHCKSTDLNVDEMRICAVCGFEEHIPWASVDRWSGRISGPRQHPSRGDYTNHRLVGDGYVYVVSRDDFYKLRP